MSGWESVGRCRAAARSSWCKLATSAKQASPQPVQLIPRLLVRGWDAGWAAVASHPSTHAPTYRHEPTWPTSTRVTPPDTPGSTSRTCRFGLHSRRGSGLGGVARDSLQGGSAHLRGPDAGALPGGSLLRRHDCCGCCIRGAAVHAGSAVQLCTAVSSAPAGWLGCPIAGTRAKRLGRARVRPPSMRTRLCTGGVCSTSMRESLIVRATIFLHLVGAMERGKPAGRARELCCWWAHRRATAVRCPRGRPPPKPSDPRAAARRGQPGRPGGPPAVRARGAAPWVTRPPSDRRWVYAVLRPGGPNSSP